MAFDLMSGLRNIRTVNTPAVASVFGDLYVRAASLALAVAVSRGLGFRAFGVFAFTLASATLLAPVIDAGLATRLALALRDPESPRRQVRETIQQKSLLAIPFLAGHIALTWSSGFLAQSPLLAIAVGAQYLVQEYSSAADAVNRNLGRVYPGVYGKFLRASLTLAGAAGLMVWPSFGLTAACLVVASVGELLMNLGALPTDRQIPEEFKIPESSRRSRLMPFALLTVGVGIYARADSVLIGYILGPVSVAIYASAYRFFDAVLMVPNAIARVAVRTQSRTGFDRTKCLVRRSAVLGVLCALAVAALAVLGITRIFGGDWHTSRNVLLILSAGLPGTFVSAILLNYLMSRRATAWICPSTACLQAAINLGLNAALLPRIGLLGSAALYAALELVNPIAYFVFLRQYITKDLVD